MGLARTKFQLLEEALEVATDLLEATDSAALVFFDAAVSTPLSISAMGGGGAVVAALADPAIQPAGGRTGIGAGLIAGAGELDDYIPPSGVPDPNLAILCLTDGNENEDPKIGTTPVTDALAAYAGDLYAIGLGTEDNVSADTLGAISNYMLVTGDLTADVRRFMVTKYFVQIVADIKKGSIIVDPEGTLLPEVVHEVHFDVTEADVAIDVVVLSTYARLIAIQIETPGGDTMTAPALGPNASLRSNRLDSILRIGLPALPGSPATSHAGRWTVRLRLADGKGHQDKIMIERSLAAMALRPNELRAGVPFNVLVQTRSNLSLNVGRDAPRVLPGGDLPLALTLSQYGLELASAHVTAAVTDPHGRMRIHTLTRDGANRFVAAIPAPLQGVYTCRIIARGTSMGGMRFTREATRTFAVGRPVPASASPPTPRKPDALCSVLACLLNDPAIQKLLDSEGVDLPQLRRCLEIACCLPDSSDDRDDPCTQPVKPSSGAPRESDSPTQPQQILRLLRMVASAAGSKGGSVVPPIVPVKKPRVDPALFDKPMFMPVMTWNKEGEAINIVGPDGDICFPAQGSDDAKKENKIRKDKKDRNDHKDS